MPNTFFAMAAQKLYTIYNGGVGSLVLKKREAGVYAGVGEGRKCWGTKKVG